jgi:hypothetical protein
MLRHFQLFAAAPGREADAEAALARWIEAVSVADEFRGGAVLREYAGEFGDIQGALALTYDVESRETGAAFRQAIAAIANPMNPDVPGDEPADQGDVLFTAASAHAHDAHDGDGHEHVPHEAHRSAAAAPLRFDRGGGLLARLMHGHFTVVATGPSSVADPVAAREA